MRRGSSYLDKVLVSEAVLPSQAHLSMGMLSCLQITDTRLWLTYRPDSDGKLKVLARSLSGSWSHVKA